MKNSIIILPFTMLLLVSGFNAKAEVAATADQTLNAMQIDSFKVKGAGDKQYYVAKETTIFDPGIYFVADYSSSAEQMIAADNQITESALNSEDLLVFKAKTIEQIIAADNQIIDAKLPAVAPLHIVEVTIPTVVCTPMPKSKM